MPRLKRAANKPPRVPIQNVAQPGSRRKWTSKEVKADKQARWEKSFVKRGVKNERHVDVESIGPNHICVQRITALGLAYFFTANPRYIKGLVADFYKNMKVPELGKIEAKGAKFTSKIGWVTIVVDPNIIARALNYERPPAESLNCPREDFASRDEIRGALGVKGVRGGSYLTSMPPKRAKQSVWQKLLFCQGVATMNSHCKLKKEIQENAKSSRGSITNWIMC
ncbi:hypothetical protein RHSIM_RhsimUnG0031200 [Rhododendron simsii]|uniref:Uncharacterized protein n=1 Tax=Rhododendron simsii TaxID=118357 RepID=A0A834FWP7_RHOSS|nr:hypothetical protein RHSIM_RhsimUnG0031200 [Rhododendron simsii]